MGQAIVDNDLHSVWQGVRVPKPVSNDRGVLLLEVSEG